MRLSYNLPRAEPLAKPTSLLPPRPRRRSVAMEGRSSGSWTQGHAMRHGASDRSLEGGGSVFDAATVRLTTPEQDSDASQQSEAHGQQGGYY